MGSKAWNRDAKLSVLPSRAKRTVTGSRARCAGRGSSLVFCCTRLVESWDVQEFVAAFSEADSRPHMNLWRPWLRPDVVWGSPACSGPGQASSAGRRAAERARRSRNPLAGVWANLRWNGGNAWHRPKNCWPRVARCLLRYRSQPRWNFASGPFRFALNRVRGLRTSSTNTGPLITNAPWKRALNNWAMIVAAVGAPDKMGERMFVSSAVIIRSLYHCACRRSMPLSLLPRRGTAARVR